MGLRVKIVVAVLALAAVPVAATASSNPVVAALQKTASAGSSTTKYHVLLDLDKAAAANPRARAAITKMEQLANVRRIPEDVWVDADGRVRQLRVVTPVTTNGVRGTSTTTITYLAYNVPV